MSNTRSPQIVSLRRACVIVSLLCSLRCFTTERKSPNPPHQRTHQCEFPPLSLLLMHTNIPMHRHSVLSLSSSASSRCLKTGGTSVLSSPLPSSGRGHLWCGKDFQRSRQSASRLLLPTTKTQNPFKRNASALAVMTFLSPSIFPFLLMWIHTSFHQDCFLYPKISTKKCVFSCKQLEKNEH